ncbi:hypothetical protein JHK86_015482 [Glycine max]|nr:hypothetical protein JHK86_015482 [Glycine max]
MANIGSGYAQLLPDPQHTHQNAQNTQPDFKSSLVNMGHANVAMQSNAGLRENVKNLHAKYLGNETCRLMLLQPINSSEDYCRGLKLNAYVTDPRHYQICENSPKC